MDAKTKALMVITKDEKIRSFLEKNDPKALEQCEEALSVEYMMISLRDAASRLSEEIEMSVGPTAKFFEFKRRMDAEIEKSRKILPPIS